VLERVVGRVEKGSLSLILVADRSMNRNRGRRLRLIEAAKGGDIVKVKQLLLDNEADIEAQNQAGWTALMVAAGEGHKETVEYLLGQGADITAKGRNCGFTALLVAARWGRVEVVKCLLDGSADIEARSKMGWTPLITAASEGHKEVVEYLLAGGAKIEAQNMSGNPALIKAAEEGRMDVVKCLLDREANTEARDSYCYTALIAAAKNGHEEVVTCLLDKKAQIEARTGNGDTALLVAAANGQTKVVECLLSRGADVEARNKEGKTAAEQTSAAEVRELLMGALTRRRRATKAQSKRVIQAKARATHDRGEAAKAEVLVPKPQEDATATAAQKLADLEEEAAVKLAGDAEVGEQPKSAPAPGKKQQKAKQKKAAQKALAELRAKLQDEEEAKTRAAQELSELQAKVQEEREARDRAADELAKGKKNQEEVATMLELQRQELEAQRKAMKREAQELQERRRALERAQELREEVLEGSDSPPVRRWTRDEVSIACNDFAQENLIGSGTFADVFGGRCSETQMRVAVKKLRFPGGQNGAALAAAVNKELEMLMKLRHVRLVPLLGACLDSPPCLIFALMQNGSLQSHLQDEEKRRAMDGKRRMNIALHLFEALRYLHEECPIRIVHRDVKPANVLLDENMCARLSDVGVALVIGEDTMHVTAVGTMTHMCPKHACEGLVSDKIDIYSAGVVVAELLAGKPASRGWMLRRGPTSIVEQLEAESDSLADHSVTWPEESIHLMAQLALSCCHEEPDRRPSAAEEAQKLLQFWQ
jgi:ankyrin repeat protein